MIQTFSPEEQQAFESQRRKRWWHGATDLLPWSRKTGILRSRRDRLFDVWTNPGRGSQGWEETLDAITADGTQISNSTSETIVAPDFNIPAYYMAAARTLRVWAFGVMSNVVTTPGTLTMRVRWGGVAGTVLVASAAQNLDTTARTNSLWALQAFVTCRTSGSSGTFLSGGILWCNVLSNTAANLLPALLGSAGAPLASGSAAVTVDTTAAKLLSVTAQFSVSTSPTNLTCQQRIIEVLN
jgi:hypothetical protein